ncbi:hypothetical protein GCM10018775_46160 [Streptomyces umbrinus]|nr:hypothetical protein GCM10018775_46160 [Streptomyces umbrinus]
MAAVVIGVALLGEAPALTGVITLAPRPARRSRARRGLPARQSRARLSLRLPGDGAPPSQRTPPSDVASRPTGTAVPPGPRRVARGPRESVLPAPSFESGGHDRPWPVSKERRVTSMIEARELTKRYGDKTVVDNLSFTVKPGEVTGFLGPNGAGKSTTMRMVVGLDSPDGGSVTVNGRPYARHPAPLHEIGSLLEAKSVHPGRTAFNHLMALAYTHGIARGRVDEVIELAGLTSVAGKRVGAFSLGMGQRLGIAAALLGDPAIVMLDEPVNGLDPEGVLWVRNLLRRLADEGRAVMLSSHLMSETAQIADHLVIIGRGRLLVDTTVDDFIRDAGSGGVKVATADTAGLRSLLVGPDVTITSSSRDELMVHGRDAREIGAIAAAHGLALHELTPQAVSLEQAFMDLTRDAVEYQSAPADTARKAA